MISKKPAWLRKKIDFASLQAMETLTRGLGLHTICETAKCPNQSECFGRGTATFLIMGVRCTRHCTFCNVSYGQPEPIDGTEPIRVAEAVKRLGLRYAVITSVTRDDLEDGGGKHFARTIRDVKKVNPGVVVEVLVPDFVHAIDDLLERAKEGKKGVFTKSGLMLGLGEREDELISVMEDLRHVGCDMLTLGQYLAPSREHFPVQEYIPPERFETYGQMAKEMGFLSVASGPFVRSSYFAEAWIQANGANQV
jgi:lipoic acid synthetase